MAEKGVAIKMQNFYDCITDFIFIEDAPQKADIIFVPGGNYPDSARNAARLYREGYAPYIMPSGKYSITKGRFEYAPENPTHQKHFETECDYLCDILLREGVPQSAILREDEATYTYENAIYSRKKLRGLGISVTKAILSCQAFHARRSLMYYQEQFGQVQFFVCPVVTRGISRTSWMNTDAGIDTVLGEVERCGAQFHEIMRVHKSVEPPLIMQ